MIGNEQLWIDYLDANNLLLTYQQSQLASREFSQIQNQLLQILTIGEIELLKQTPTQTTLQFRNPQAEAEYFGIIEEARNTQVINLNYHY